MTTQTPPAGWYADPLSAGGHRYWDGSAWTEHTALTPAAPTAPAATPAPAAAPADPAVGANSTAASTTAQIPRQSPSTASQPYAFAVTPPGAHVPRPPQQLYPPRGGRSTGVKVLIGVAIAAGALVILGILAAIAIPVFLDQRAKSAASATLVLPETAAGLVRSSSADTGGLAEPWLSGPLPGKKSAAFYDTGAGQRRALVLVSQVAAGPDDQAAFLAGVEDEAVRNKVLGWHPVDAGELSGQMRCGSTAEDGGTICAFVSRGLIGTVNVLGPDGDAIATQLHDAIRITGS